MSESSEKRTLGPHFLIIGVIIVVILALVFWPSKEEEVVVAPVRRKRPGHKIVTAGDFYRH